MGATTYHKEFEDNLKKLREVVDFFTDINYHREATVLTQLIESPDSQETAKKMLSALRTEHNGTVVDGNGAVVDAFRNEWGDRIRPPKDGKKHHEDEGQLRDDVEAFTREEWEELYPDYDYDQYSAGLA